MKVVLVVWDGFRPEFVRSELTPALCAFSDRGVTFSRHSAVFPTETRVNSASIGTGRYPDGHGIVANRFLDRPSRTDVNTGSESDLASLAEAAGSLLPVSTVSERLSEAKRRSLVVGAGSPGSTLLQAPERPDRLVNTRGVVRPPDAEREIIDAYGGFPDASGGSAGWNDLACRIFIDGVRSGSYEFGVLWLCDPDFTQHKEGLGAPASLSAIRANDERLKELFDGLSEDVDLLVASDHGFSTASPGGEGPGTWLDLPPDRFRAAGSGIYLSDPEEDLAYAVSALRSQPWAGPVFLRASDDETKGVVPGTYDLSLLRASREDRSPDIVFSKRWSGKANAHGVRGTIYGTGGVATHGSLSPFDRRCVLIAGGPSFRSGVRSDLPSDAVDVPATVAHLLGLPDEGDGRVLGEALAGEDGPTLEDLDRWRPEACGGYTLEFCRVAGKTYLDSVTAEGRF